MASSSFSTIIPIRFLIDNHLKLEGELREILAPRTINRIVSLLPLSGRVHLWKGEVYFAINAKIGAEKAKSQCKAGDIAYWPQGDAICLFFHDMIPYSKVNPIGRLKHTELEEFFIKIKAGTMIQIHSF